MIFLDIVAMKGTYVSKVGLASREECPTLPPEFRLKKGIALSVGERQTLRQTKHS
jgi:hypothetical protein